MLASIIKVFICIVSFLKKNFFPFKTQKFVVPSVLDTLLCLNLKKVDYFGLPTKDPFTQPVA